MHIRLTLSSNYYENIYSSDNPKYCYTFKQNIKEEQNDINFKTKQYYQIGGNVNFSDAQTTHKMLTSIMQIRMQ